jgi:hypothetical protein
VVWLVHQISKYFQQIQQRCQADCELPQNIAKAGEGEAKTSLLDLTC